MRSRRARVSVLVAAAVTLGLAAGCSTAAQVPRERFGQGPHTPVRLADAPAAEDVVSATWHLGMEALRASGSETGTVVSPSSLVTALAMLAEGAQGDEVDPFDRALGASGQERTDAVNALQSALDRFDGDPSIVQAEELPPFPMVHTAQRLVIDERAQPASAFLDRLQRGFGAGVLITDLRSPSGIDALSAWVRENTGGLVERSAIEPSPDLAAVIQDAVVLAAAWKHPFDQGDTHDADFTVPGTGNVQTSTMSATLTVPAVYADGEQAANSWQAVRLPYSDTLSADLLLPPSCGSVCQPGETCPDVCDQVAHDPALADATTVAGLSSRLDDADSTTVRVSLPTLDMTSTTDLAPVLGVLGITERLTGILADETPVEVSQAVQQAVLRVDEDGTRAAAVTEIGIRVVSSNMDEAREIAFDRPFLLVVRDNQTGWPLFIASVIDPRH
ncbi:MAG: serpin family protein [Micrococcales bacterium]|nr:serpin family protein [Micrococcales bacterium]